MSMGEEVSTTKPNQIRPSSSFRLHSQGLNFLRLRRIFYLFDKNGDEMITVEDLGQALNLLGLEAEFSELESTVLAYIKEGKTGLEFEDFVTLHKALGDTYFGGEDEMANDQDQEEDAEESDLIEAFKVFDLDGDGYISAKELQIVLEKLGFPETSEMDRVHKMILSVDHNNDGRIDLLEFKDMMQSVVVRTI